MINEKLQSLREEITASPNYNSKLNVWANSAANICHEIATSKEEDIKVDRFFYAFQSPPIKNPKFLIIAFNPSDRFETTYEIGCKNENRNYERITGNVLKEPNMTWDQHHTWRIWQNLKKSFVSTEMNELLNSFVYMNMVFFGSKNVDTFNNKNSGAKFAKKVCTELTNILAFEIFKPQIILCLGDESFAGIGNEFEQIQVTNSSIDNKAKSKQVNKTLVIGMPHPSGARNLTDVYRVNIGEALHDLIFETPITSANRVNLTQHKFDKSIMDALLNLVRRSEFLSRLNITEGKEKGGNIRYVIEGFDNDKLEITISSQGFTGIRFAKSNGQYSDITQSDMEIYVKLLNSHGFSSDDKAGNWIGKKSFYQYNTIVLSDLNDFIENDIKKVIEEIQVGALLRSDACRHKFAS